MTFQTKDIFALAFLLLIIIVFIIDVVMFKKGMRGKNIEGTPKKSKKTNEVPDATRSTAHHATHH